NRGNSNRGNEGRSGGGDSHRNRNGQSGERSGGGNRAPRKTGPKEPQTFEDMMKQYMSESETKFSQLNRGERGGRSRRRSRG
ncbi:MAG: hypothetical protein LUG44_10565, partial [Clostridiales bacterium]|nr:hypothetical protein [Clostridiales bacterium]